MVENCPHLRGKRGGETINNQAASAIAFAYPELRQSTGDHAPYVCVDLSAIGDAAPNEPQPSRECVVRTFQHGANDRGGCRIQFESELDHLRPRSLHCIVNSLGERIRTLPDKVACCEVFLDDGIGELKLNCALSPQHAVR
jgi:hypothetical protein